ncbi:putative 40S ribosomal protein S8-like [Capsicum annuum]|nr:putative 40S ribosomal protein S8-like [Capsicum annuum]KAF3649710.1 putative 40S ribosomal protein S8-like [Capsicum annuum]
MVELNGDGQGSDNGSNLPVRFLGRLSQKSVFSPISVARWDRMPKKKKQVMWEIIEDKIPEHLPEDQELAISYGVPLKILAHPNDAIGKVFGSEHSGRVCGLGGSVCPSKAFGMFRNSHVNLGSSSSISRQRVEDLEKQVETLKEKLTGYEETKENLATLHSFLQSKFGSELPTLNQSS